MAMIRQVLKIFMCFFPSLVFTAEHGNLLIHDPILGNRTVVYEKKDGYALVEGDIIAGKLTEINGRTAVIKPVISGTRWTDKKVPYEIDEDLPLMNKLAVFQAIAHWQKFTDLQFVEVNSKNRHHHPDYIVFQPASGTTCSSWVGRHGGRQEINLSTRCTSMNTVHEIGHALGLWHEQSRSDRDDYILILWENIEEGHQYNFEQHLSNSLNIGEYDYQSIMHYGPFAFSKNGKPTLMPLAEGVEIGQRNQLSDKDVAAVMMMYDE